MSSITVLVPSYNHAPFVERTLRSIFAQTRRPEKLIVIDDGSRDGSAAAIERVLRESPIESEFVARENRGLSATLNEGFAKAGGEYFAYLGSDDIWLPNFLEEQADLLESRPSAVLAFSHAYVIDERDHIVDRTDNWSAFADGDMLPLLLSGQVFSSPGVLYRRSALARHGWNEDAALEDYELYLRLCADGEFARNTKLLCGWRRHGWNTSRDFAKMVDEWLRAQNQVGPLLGIDEVELASYGRKLKFDAAAGYMRAGHRRKAFELFRDNLSAAGSFGNAAKMLLRIATPRRVFEWNRRRMHAAAIRRYGKLEY